MRPVPVMISAAPRTSRGAVAQGRHVQRSTTLLQLRRQPRHRFAGRREAGRDVRLVAEGLVLRLAAAAQRGAQLLVGHAVGGNDADRRVQGQRAVLAHAHQVDRRRGFRIETVVARVADRPGDAAARHPSQAFGRGHVGEDPVALLVGLEHLGFLQHAVARMDAAARVEPDGAGAAAHDLGPVGREARRLLGRLARRRPLRIVGATPGRSALAQRVGQGRQRRQHTGAGRGVLRQQFHALGDQPGR